MCNCKQAHIRQCNQVVTKLKSMITREQRCASSSNSVSEHVRKERKKFRRRSASLHRSSCKLLRSPRWPRCTRSGVHESLRAKSQRHADQIHKTQDRDTRHESQCRPYTNKRNAATRALTSADAAQTATKNRSKMPKLLHAFALEVIVRRSMRL